MQAARGASLRTSEREHTTSTRTTGRTRSRVVLAAVVAALALALDVVTKILATHKLADRAPVHVVGDLLQLTLARNPGAAFSTGTSITPLITAVAIVAAAVTLRYLVRVGTPGWAVALGLLLAGITGNLLDRLFRQPGPMRGHVVDFLQLPHWPVFNVADMCINLAAALIVIQAVRGVHLDGSRSRPDADDD